MLLITTPNELLPALSVAGQVISGKATLPILDCLWCRVTEDQTLHLLGSDLQTWIGYTVTVTADTAGSLAIPAKKLRDIAKYAPPDTALNLKYDAADSHCVITCGRSRYRVGTLPPDDFPVENPSQEWMIRNTHWLKQAIAQTAYAMPTNDARYYLNGLRLIVDTKSWTMVGTDGHRLAICTGQQTEPLELEGPRAIILPCQGVKLLKRLLPDGLSPQTDVAVSDQARTFRMTAGPLSLTTRLVEGQYPDYTRIMPKPTSWATVDRELLIQAAHQTGLLAHEIYRGIRLSFLTNSIELTARNEAQDEAEIEIAADMDLADEIHLGIQVDYLLAALHVITSSQVQIGLINSDSAIQLQGVNETTIHVIMPMRL